MSRGIEASDVCVVAASMAEGDGREFEIKLAFDPADLAAIESHPLLAALSVQKETLLSVYYDTEDRLLWKARLALRVRKIGSRYVQTLKGSDGGAELFDRPEWEQEISSIEPDLRLAANTPLARLLDNAPACVLAASFRTHIDRAIYRVPRGHTEIELAIDEGEIEADARRSAVHEVELELKRGEPKALFELARILAASVPLRLAVKTKAERGYELSGEIAPGPEKAKPIALEDGMDCASAFRAIAENCLRQVVNNAEIIGVEETEGLHQMRVGLRRLRAAIAMFSKMTGDSEQARIKAELKWITNELGPARDLDVIITDILKPLDKHGHHAEAHRAFAAARDKAYAAAKSAIASDRFRSLLLDLVEWIVVGPWTTDPDKARRGRDIAEHAAKRLTRMRDFVREKGLKLRELDPKPRHKLRIKAKNMRYAIEFLDAIFPGGEHAKRRETALSALKDLQDELGALNDFAQREALARDALGPIGNGLPPEAAKLLTADHKDVERRFERAEAAFNRFDDTKPFWD
jgi:inorganic triphosphatase YgiF